MNTAFIFSVEPRLAEIAAGQIAGTVVLVLLVAAVAWLAKSLLSLRSEVEALQDSLRPKPRPVPKADTAAPGLTPGEIAIIAAAVHVVLGHRARLVTVGVTDSSGQQVWSLEGRRQVFQSHQLR